MCPENQTEPTREPLDARHVARLLTRDDKFVTRVRVPPFQRPMELIQWGTRIFILTDVRMVRPDGTPEYYYREGIMHFASSKAEMDEPPPA